MTPAPRRLLAALAPALAAAVLVPVGAASAAIPPGCGSLDLDDPAAVVANAEGTDDVFIGRVVGIDSAVVGGATGTAGATPTGGAGSLPGTEPTDRGTTRPVRHEVVVEDALTGDLRPGQPVRVVFTVVDGEQTQLRLNANYVFFATGEDGVLQADGCDGYVSARNLDAATVDVLRDALAPEDDEVVLSAPEGGSDGPPDLGRVVAPGAAVSLIGVLGLVLLSRVGRQRP